VTREQRGTIRLALDLLEQRTREGATAGILTSVERDELLRRAREVRGRVLGDDDEARTGAMEARG
jgi:hypothetical protein